jgi:glycerate 2-kinase
VTSTPLSDALDISGAWRESLELDALVGDQLRDAGVANHTVDVVAIGKASRTMASACAAFFGDKLLKKLLIVDGASESSPELDVDVVVGEHPLPGSGSVRAGARLLEFLDAPTTAQCTVFLVSGGASSLCVVPEPPMHVDDVVAIFRAALETGINITTLNQLRAATSAIAGGGILRHVSTQRSIALIMVDNVVSGAAWVASALTYEYQPERSDVTALLEAINRATLPLATTVYESFERRRVAMQRPVTTAHENRVVAQPSMVLDITRQRAQQHGYRVVSLGSEIHGDVNDVADQWADVISRELSKGDRLCVVGVGEVTVRVSGSGKGGRCQAIAWAMAKVLERTTRDGVFVARATDGRDFVQGVGGAWVDTSTIARAASLGIDWAAIAVENDTFRGLSALGQVIEGSGTGWNLCDLYVAIL